MGISWDLGENKNGWEMGFGQKFGQEIGLNPLPILRTPRE